jgi:cell division protease FtsH
MQNVVKKRSILLYGPPGTGKTSCIKATFNAFEGKDVTCVIVSDGAIRHHNPHDLFKFANHYLSPCVLVLEDIDLMAGDRKSARSQVIGEMLAILDGIETFDSAISVIATTNDIDALDQAVVRPCRFDRRIELPAQDEETLCRIFNLKTGLNAPANAFANAKGSKNKLTAAHIEAISREAKLIASFKNEKIENCIAEAIRVVKDEFFISSGGKGRFGFDLDKPVVDDDDGAYEKVACGLEAPYAPNGGGAR